MLERKANNASQEELFHHQSHSPQSEVIQKANMFAAVWINKFAHAQRHREPLAESLKNLANDSKESVHWEPVLDSHPYSAVVLAAAETHLKKPRSTADLFMITESSWLYPVYDAIATMELIPEKQISVGDVMTTSLWPVTWKTNSPGWR